MLSNRRINSIDILRGLVMVIMALDHTREYFSLNGFFTDATNLQTTTPLLFFTRWITHFCAPTFVFLSGTSAYLSGLRSSPAEHRRFLLKRGLWLLFLEFTVVNFSLWFDIRFSLLTLQVIGAIGISFIVLSLLARISIRAILGTGLFIVITHNLLDLYTPEPGTAAQVIYTILNRPGILPISPTHSLLILYPVLAWLGIFLVGYGTGRIFLKTPFQRKKILLSAGIACLSGFALLRLINLYGDQAPWQPQATPLFTVMSFLNVSKYPPSLLYALVTLGVSLCFLGLIEGKKSGFFRVLSVYGTVPLFYYILHFYLIHALSVLRIWLSGHPWDTIDFQKGTGGNFPNEGWPLWAIYPTWIAIVVFLYPLCRWYGDFKKRQTFWVWRYL